MIAFQATPFAISNSERSSSRSGSRALLARERMEVLLVGEEEGASEGAEGVFEATREAEEREREWR
jgi:hypothetical protein